MSAIAIPGLESDDVAILRNARNFAYYCQMIKDIRSKVCPFCDPMNQTMNPICATSGEWRMWECPKEFRAKNLSQHFVIAPKYHVTDMINFSVDDFMDLWALISIALKAIPNTGNQLYPHLGTNDVGVDGAYGLIVVPSGKHKVECVFDKTPNPHYSDVPLIKRVNEWFCYSIPTFEDIASKLLIAPVFNEKELDFVIGSPDFDDIASLISYLLNRGLRQGLPGGAFLMGFYGAAVVMRFGDPRLHSGSIRHLHCNVMVPDENGRVDVTLTKDPEKIAHKVRVLAVWEKMRLWIVTHPGKSEKDALRILDENELSIIQNRA